MQPETRFRKRRWGPIAFLVAITLATVVGVPVYVASFGLSASEVALFVGSALATSLAVTLGYHRLFAHATFEAHVLVRFFVLLFGAAAFEQSALKWAWFHRRHHAEVDTARDPYNIGDGFLYAHVGWILSWKHWVDYSNVADLSRSRLVRHQNEHYKLWSLGAGLVLPVLVGAALGHAFGGFLFAVGARSFVVLNSAFLVNSAAHSFGRRPFDPSVSARDSALVALLTHGEGYHNFHHCFPGDYRNGVAWSSWDPTKWLIWSLSAVGLAWDLRRTPPEAVARAREAARAASPSGS